VEYVGPLISFARARATIQAIQCLEDHDAEYRIRGDQPWVRRWPVALPRSPGGGPAATTAFPMVALSRPRLDFWRCDFQTGLIDRMRAMREGVERGLRKDGAMRFLLRTAFWVSVALALLPSFVTKQATVPIKVAAAEAISAAFAAVNDLSGFCERRPDACAAGAQFASAFGQRAQAGAKIVYEFVGDKLGHPERAVGVAAKEAPAAEIAKASRDTLTSADMTPAWRGPPPLRTLRASTPGDAGRQREQRSFSISSI
jgi:hypothetical protein